MDTIIIAFDGTAASGKGSVAKLVAKKLSFDYLDTGVMFRKLAYNCIKNDISLDDMKSVTKQAGIIDFNEEEGSEMLQSNIVSDAASKIAIYHDVRDILLNVQRDFTNNKKGVVVDGRDIGTVVFPNARFKFFFDASIEERANRRFNQLQKKGKDVKFSDVFECLKIRDERDQNRCLAPLRMSKDYFGIDTTSLSISEVLSVVLKKIKIN
jgi:cytidylate kinase